jgi:hypothetical protein
MAKLKPSIDNKGGQQLLFDLFNFLSQTPTQPQPIAGSLNLDAAIRDLVSIGLKKTSLDRIGVAAEMSRLLGKEISKSMLDAFSAESKEKHRFPAAFLNAFVEVTGDKSLLRLLCEKAGGFFIDNEAALNLSFLNLREQKKDISRREKILMELINNLQRKAPAK